MKDLQITCHKDYIILCSETLVSNRRHISEISLPGKMYVPVMNFRSSESVVSLIISISLVFTAIPI